MSTAPAMIRQADPSAAAASRPRRGGHPRDSDNPAKRRTKMRWAFLVLSGQVLVKEAAFVNRVERHTITRWIRQMLQEEGTEGDALRRLDGRRR